MQLTLNEYFNIHLQKRYNHLIAKICSAYRNVSTEVIKDLLHDILLNLLEQKDNRTFPSIESIERYIIIALKNRLSNYLNRRKVIIRLIDLIDDDNDLDYGDGIPASWISIVDRNFEQIEVENLFELAQLRENEKEILRRKLDGYKNDEIAHEFNISERTVRRIMERIKRKLINFLRK